MTSHLGPWDICLDRYLFDLGFAFDPGNLFWCTESGEPVKTCVPWEIQTLSEPGRKKGFSFCLWSPQTATWSCFLCCAGWRQESAPPWTSVFIAGELPWKLRIALTKSAVSRLLGLLMRTGSPDLPKILLQIRSHAGTSAKEFWQSAHRS